MIEQVSPRDIQLNVLATLIESMLYGGFLVLVIITLVSTARKTITSQVIRIHVVGLMLLCLASIHVISNIVRIIRGFGGGGSIMVQFGSPIYLLQQAVFMLQIILGDGSWLYRLHIVWEGDKHVTYPFSVVFISTIGLGIHTIILTGKIPANAVSMPHETQTAAIASVVLALASSIGYTTLIAFRVCCVNQRVKKYVFSSSHALEDFIVLVIESGAIYTAFLLVLLISLMYNNTLCLIPDQAIIQVVGIAYYMMLFQSTLPRGNHYPRIQTETRNCITRQVEDIELSLPEASHPVVVHVSKLETTV